MKTTPGQGEVLLLLDRFRPTVQGDRHWTAVSTGRQVRVVNLAQRGTVLVCPDRRTTWSAFQGLSAAEKTAALDISQQLIARGDTGRTAQAVAMARQHRREGRRNRALKWFGSWGLWLALAYLSLWENLLSRISDGTARLSIRSYLVSIVSWGTDEEIALADRSDAAALIVPILVAMAATALTARTLRRRDVD